MRDAQATVLQCNIRNNSCGGFRFEMAAAYLKPSFLRS
jgi:hypothetical protein